MGSAYADADTHSEQSGSVTASQKMGSPRQHQENLCTYQPLSQGVSAVTVRSRSVPPSQYQNISGQGPIFGIAKSRPINQNVNLHRDANAANYGPPRVGGLVEYCTPGIVNKDTAQVVVTLGSLPRSQTVPVDRNFTATDQNHTKTLNLRHIDQTSESERGTETPVRRGSGSPKLSSSTQTTREISRQLRQWRHSHGANRLHDDARIIMALSATPIGINEQTVLLDQARDLLAKVATDMDTFMEFMQMVSDR